MIKRHPNEQRTLVLAPQGRDAETISHVLHLNQISSFICADIGMLTNELVAGAGAALITDEALESQNLAPLIDWLAAQPAWSDFPFILLTQPHSMSRKSLALGALESLSNVVLLERPLNTETLKRATTSALRARRRQYEARAALQQRLQAEERLGFALKAGRLGAWEIDVSKRVLSTSDICKENFGQPIDRPFTYQALLSCIHPDDLPAYQEALQSALGTRDGFVIEMRAMWPDQSIHWVQIRGETRFTEDNRPQRVAGVSLDVTERMESARQLSDSQHALHDLNATLERRIEERTCELAQLNDRLMHEISERERTQAASIQGQKMEAIGRLTGGIAHDFNNLLHVSIGNLELIDRFTADERIKRFTATARKALNRGAKLTGQLLAFARNQSMDLKAVDLAVLIDGMQELLSVSVGSAINIDLDYATDVPPALADPNQIEMAILNLAINARDAMPNGGTLLLRTDCRDADDDLLKPGPYAVVSVTDNGTGIRAEHLGKVFDPFFTTKQIGKGTGLGLSQVYGMAKQSGGGARIHSQLGEGTTVELWLPLAPKNMIAPSSVEIRNDEAPGPSDLRILVVEDDSEVRQFMVESLEMLGYQVSAAADGVAGLTAIKREAPDLLIVDFLMPDMNGAQVIAAVTEILPTLPIIVATGYADMRAIDEVIGSNFVLRKPFQISELARLVNTALSTRKAAGGRRKKREALVNGK
ncbi:MAG: histidine kinase [Herbaspirillum sp.]|jgi:signal transduction histidine kinase/ActR/RegA family two-component response regulator|nr:histidine kinase [Herbaspirillum sp.]